MVAVKGMTDDAETRQNVEKRCTEGRTEKEIRRCIKRYMSRRISRPLNASSETMSSVDR